MPVQKNKLAEAAQKSYPYLHRYHLFPLFLTGGQSQLHGHTDISGYSDPYTWFLRWWILCRLFQVSDTAGLISSNIQTAHEHNKKRSFQADLLQCRTLSINNSLGSYILSWIIFIARWIIISSHLLKGIECCFHWISISYTSLIGTSTYSFISILDLYLNCTSIIAYTLIRVRWNTFMITNVHYIKKLFITISYIILTIL